MKRSKHSLSNYQLLTCNQAKLVPCGLLEVLPGDTVQQATSLLIRVAPLVTPVMHPVIARIHHWFIPFRLIWEDFEKFITGGPDGADASVAPTYNPGVGSAFNVGTLGDYLGIPTGVNNLTVSALPFRAYNLVWNEFYRDQVIQSLKPISKASGVDVTTDVGISTVNWEKDYFTTCRLDPQLGPDVTLPLGTQAPVKTTNTNLVTGAQQGLNLLGAAAGAALTGGKVFRSSATANASMVEGTTADNTGTSAVYPSNLYADLSTATAATVNELREAMAIQRYEEARARYGSRYTEYLRYLGVRSSDARLQRPEYLGGGKTTVQFSEVLQTSPTTSGTPITGVGALAGHGIGAVRSNRYRRFFEEHGYVLSLLSVLPKTIYASGLPRMWTRTSKEDFYQRELEHIGQQEVLNRETYAAHSSPTGVFGYQDRYDEYRHAESGIHGEFRTTLNSWHMARIFAGDTALNTTFITANPTDRIYQSTATHELQVMVNHSIQARRLLSKVGTSSIL